MNIPIEGSVEQRSIGWAMLVTLLMVKHPEVNDGLPADCTLIVLPKGDPEVAAYNLACAKAQGATPENAVVCEIEAHEDDTLDLYPHVPQPRPILGLSV